MPKVCGSARKMEKNTSSPTLHSLGLNWTHFYDLAEHSALGLFPRPSVRSVYCGPVSSLRILRAEELERLMEKQTRARLLKFKSHYNLEGTLECFSLLLIWPLANLE